MLVWHTTRTSSSSVSVRYATRMLGTFVRLYEHTEGEHELLRKFIILLASFLQSCWPHLMSLPIGPGKCQFTPRACSLRKRSKPLMRTLLAAISHMSHDDSFHTWAATLYSSIKGSRVKWNCRGSSAEKKNRLEESKDRKKAANK